MFEFNQLENFQLRKHSELHQIYYLDYDLIVMLINFKTAYYFDVIQLQLKVSRKLIKIDCIPIFAFICGESSIGLANYDQRDSLIIQSFDFHKMNIVKKYFKLLTTYKNFSTFYFKRTQLSMLLFHYECGSIICYFLNCNLEIKSQFHLIDKTKNQLLQSIYQLNQNNCFISLYLENYLEYKLCEINSQGIQSNLQSKYLDDQNSLNGCAQSKKQILLAFTPKNNSNSFIEFINEQNESIKIIEINCFQNYIVSIEQILFVNDLYVCCKISTQSEEELEQLCLFDINTFNLVSRKIYQDYMLDIQCSESIIIETSMNLFDRINCLQKNHEILSNQEHQFYKEDEFHEFDDFSDITIFYNLNPIYQAIKIMKFLEFEEYIVEQIAQKLNKSQANNLKKQILDFN